MTYFTQFKVLPEEFYPQNTTLLFTIKIRYM
jgi:hypothetical protein